MDTLAGFIPTNRGHLSTPSSRYNPFIIRAIGIKNGVKLSVLVFSFKKIKPERCVLGSASVFHSKITQTHKNSFHP
jgi:hypothetical protein